MNRSADEVVMSFLRWQGEFLKGFITLIVEGSVELLRYGFLHPSLDVTHVELIRLSLGTREDVSSGF